MSAGSTATCEIAGGHDHRYSLEGQRGSQLKNPRLARADGLTELGIDLVARAVKARRRIDRVELRMVEDIVRLHAQTDIARGVAAQRNSLDEGHVPVVDARAAEVVRPAVPKCPLRGHRERRGIEPLRKGLRPAVRIHTRNAIRTRQDIRTTNIP